MAKVDEGLANGISRLISVFDESDFDRLYDLVEKHSESAAQSAFTKALFYALSQSCAANGLRE